MFKKIVLTGLATSALLLTGCGNNTQATDSKQVDVELGYVSENERIVWEDVASRLEEQGINLELTQFTDYNQPNQALATGDIDLNAIQHVAFLEDFKSNTGHDLTDIGFTYISPLGLYSNQYNSVEYIQDGDIIAIPNDTTNGGRALYFLEQLGLITLNKTEGDPTISDISEYKMAITIKELDAATLTGALPDVGAAIINTNFAVDAGLSPNDDALQLDTNDLSQVQDFYKNVIAARSEDADNEVYQKIVKEYQTDETKALIEETSNGADTSAF